MPFVNIRHLTRVILWLTASGLLASAASAQEKKATLALQKGDRVAWVGSSSTNIGVWPKTMEFLLRTRHPELQLTFKKFSTGGGTFDTGAKNLDKWLDDFKPTVVFLNYGGNDANAGEKGLAAYKENMAKCVARIEAAKARVIFTTFQGADTRKSGEAPATRRKLFAETQLAFCKEKGWPAIDVFHPTQKLQDDALKDDPQYTILRDTIHLTDAAYIAWGYYLYSGLDVKGGGSVLGFHTNLKLTTERGCQLGALGVTPDKSEVLFTRTDHVLPILPPGPLPPRKHVPLEANSYYGLRVMGLPEGTYELQCNRKTLGTTTAKALADGVNINSIVLESGVTPPWSKLAKQIWDGQNLESIGKTKWDWRIVRK